VPGKVARPCADLIPTLRPGGGKAYIRGHSSPPALACVRVFACVHACVRLLRLAAASHGAHIIRWRYRSPNDVRPMRRRPSHIGALSAIKSATTTLATIHQHQRCAMAADAPLVHRCPLWPMPLVYTAVTRGHVITEVTASRAGVAEGGAGGRERVRAREAMYPLYQDASKVLELMEQRKGTANRLSLNASIRNKKACLALAAETSRSAWHAFSEGVKRAIDSACISRACLRAQRVSARYARVIR
jgi:hypothetical protein